MGGGLTAAIQALEEYARFLEGWKTGMVSFRIHKGEIPEFIAIIFCSPVRFLETPVLFPRRRKDGLRYNQANPAD